MKKDNISDAVIRRLLAGETIPEAFLMKILFTAVTLGAGFRGGEIVPILCTGATFGSIAGPLLGLSQSFGGGMGRMREVCGACSGAFMVLGLKYGTPDSSDAQTKKKVYEIVQKFAARFKEENGFDSIVCRDLLGLPGASRPKPAERTAEYYKKRPCAELVALSSGLLDEFI